MKIVSRVCSEVDCDWGIKAKGLCDTHYARLLAGRDVSALIRGRGKKCVITGCIKLNRSKGFCVTHRATAERYKLSEEEVNRREKGVCDLCGGPPSQGRSLHVDHDHSCCKGDRTCGKCNRGFLCPTCNLGLGSFKDSKELMQKVIRYLDRGPVLSLVAGFESEH